jgi:hypothetical protein
MSPTVYWYNETNVTTTAELWSWLLDQDAAANEWAKPNTAQLKRLTVDQVTIAETFGPESEWVKTYAVNIGYETNQ